MRYRTIWIVLFLFLIGLPILYGFIGNNSQYNIVGSIGYSGITGNGSNQVSLSYLTDFPVGRYNSTNYNLILGAIYNIKPLMISARDNDTDFNAFALDGNPWVPGNYSLEFLTNSFDYENDTLKLFICNDTNFDISSGCLTHQICNDTTSKINSSCIIDVGEVTGIYPWYAFLYDIKNLPAINNPIGGEYRVDTVKPSIATGYGGGGIQWVDTSWSSEINYSDFGSGSNDTINMTLICSDAHSNCNQTIWYYIRPAGVNCSTDKINYTSNTTSGYVELNSTTADFLCIRAEDRVRNVNYTQISNATSNMSGSIINNCTIIDPVILINSICIDSTLSRVRLENSGVYNSNISWVYGLASNITNSSLNNVYMDGLNITRSNLTDNWITNSTVDNSKFYELIIDKSRVERNMLYVGSINYHGIYYYATYNISILYSFKPITIGNLSFNKSYSSDGSLVEITYNSPRLGYQISLDTQKMNPNQPVTILQTTNETTLHRGFITINNSGNEKIIINATLNDNLGNRFYINKTFWVDNQNPSGTISINTSSGTAILGENQDYTSSTSVTLSLTNADNFKVNLCRYKNDLENYTAWETCIETKEWQLRDEEGLRTVSYQISDMAGNIITLNDTVIYNLTGIGFDLTPPNPATVIDDGLFTNDDTQLHVRLNNASDPETNTLGLQLRYSSRVRNINNNTIKDWGNETTLTDFNITGLSLTHNQTYYIDIRTINSAGLTRTKSSDGITVDTVAPSNVNIYGITNGSFINDNSPRINFSAIDLVSGIKGFSIIKDTSPTTIPDSIPELTPYIQYDTLEEGTYYLHIKAIDNASNNGNVSHIFFGIDTRPPSIPRITSQTLNASAQTISFSWTTSTDELSGLNYYEIIIYDSNQTVLTDTTTATNYVYNGYTQNRTYYVKVRARDNAGSFSLYSNEAYRDTTPPKISNLLPSGYIISNEPVIRLNTNEVTNCVYKRIAPSNSTNRPFYYTNSIYHETKVDIIDSTLYSYSITCYDSDNNTDTDTTSFTALTNKIPQRMTLINKSNSYTIHEIVRLNLFLESTVSGSYQGVGEGNPSNFRVVIDNEDVENINTQDKGNGYYEILFTYSKIGQFPIKIYYNTASTTASIINFSTLPLKIVYNENAPAPTGNMGASSFGASSVSWDITKLFTTSGNRITYFDKDNDTTIGMGTDSTPLGTEISGASLSLTSNFNDGNQYIFMTEKSDDINRREKYMKSKTFLDLTAPNFGMNIKDDIYNIRTTYEYPGVRIISNDFDDIHSIQKGKYTFIIINRGYDTDGKKLIEVKLS